LENLTRALQLDITLDDDQHESSEDEERTKTSTKKDAPGSVSKSNITPGAKKGGGKRLPQPSPSPPPSRPTSRGSRRMTKEDDTDEEETPKVSPEPVPKKRRGRPSGGTPSTPLILPSDDSDDEQNLSASKKRGKSVKSAQPLSKREGASARKDRTAAVKAKKATASFASDSDVMDVSPDASDADDEAEIETLKEMARNAKCSSRVVRLEDDKRPKVKQLYMKACQAGQSPEDNTERDSGATSDDDGDKDEDEPHRPTEPGRKRRASSTPKMKPAKRAKLPESEDDAAKSDDDDFSPASKASKRGRGRPLGSGGRGKRGGRGGSMGPRSRSKSTKKMSEDEAASDGEDLPLKKAQPDKRQRVKTPSGDSSARPDMFATEAIQYCEVCGSIFVSASALANHVKEKHSEKASASDGEQEGVIDVPTSPEVKKEDIKKSESRKRTPSGSPSPPNTPSGSDDEFVCDDKSARAKGSKRGNDKGRGGRQGSRAPTPARGRGAGGGATECTLCDEVFYAKGAFRNHIANHFKAELLADLPQARPFICPECDCSVRDKISLMRHYAFTHKKLQNMCTDEQFNGRQVNKERATTSAAKKKTKKRAAGSDSDDDVFEDKVSSNQDEEDVTRRSFSDDKNIDEDKNGPTEDSDADDANSVAKKTTLAEPVRFSDESDDDASATVKGAIKSFDDLFDKEDRAKENGQGANGNNDTENEGGEAVVFNKDSSESDN
jgi:uncharacterized C2H2 Zn-finger protein